MTSSTASENLFLFLFEILSLVSASRGTAVSGRVRSAPTFHGRPPAPAAARWPSAEEPAGSPGADSGFLRNSNCSRTFSVLTRGGCKQWHLRHGGRPGERGEGSPWAGLSSRLCAAAGPGGRQPLVLGQAASQLHSTQKYQGSRTHTLPVTPQRTRTARGVRTEGKELEGRCCRWRTLALSIASGRPASGVPSKASS